MYKYQCTTVCACVCAAKYATNFKLICRKQQKIEMGAKEHTHIHISAKSFGAHVSARDELSKPAAFSSLRRIYYVIFETGHTFIQLIYQRKMTFLLFAESTKSGWGGLRKFNEFISAIKWLGQTPEPLSWEIERPEILSAWASCTYL